MYQIGLFLLLATISVFAGCGTDPVKSFAPIKSKVLAELDTMLDEEHGKGEWKYSEPPAYDIKKTDSALTPYVGVITFSILTEVSEEKFEASYGFDGRRWEFKNYDWSSSSPRWQRFIDEMTEKYGPRKAEKFFAAAAPPEAKNAGE